MAGKQNLESDKMIIYDSIKEDFQEKIRRLEEDRHNLVTSDLWQVRTTPMKRRSWRQFSLSSFPPFFPLHPPSRAILINLLDIFHLFPANSGNEKEWSQITNRERPRGETKKADFGDRTIPRLHAQRSRYHRRLDDHQEIRHRSTTTATAANEQSLQPRQ